MASSFHILDGKGGQLIGRTYRGDVMLDVSKVFQARVLEEEDSSVKPVLLHEGHTIVFMRHNNIYLVTVSRVNACPTLQIAFMKKCIDVFNSYFNAVTDESIRDNFVIVYELLDEMADFGFPQFTEERILKEYITQEGLKLMLLDNDSLDVKALPSSVTGIGGATQWRPAGIKYGKNEVFLDVVEHVNLLVNAEGDTLHSEILGTLKMRVHLTGMPELKLGLNDKVLFETTGRRTKGKTVELEDVKFHQCVKLNKFESDRTISFIPPDGDFDLMNYRLSTKVRPLIHVEVHIQRHGTSRVEMMIKARSNYKKTSTANEVELQIPVPGDADTPSAKANTGTVRYLPEKECMVWYIRSFPGGREFMCRCSYGLPSVRSRDPAAEAKRPVAVKFEIPYFTVSGFQVRYLKVTERSNYEALPWVRYVTQSGDYQVRTT